MSQPKLIPEDYGRKHLTKNIKHKTDKKKSQIFTVMTYNIQMLPVQLKLSLNTWIRRKAIVEYISFLDNIYDVDVLVLTEVFSSGILKLLKKGSIANNFPYCTNVLGDKQKRFKKRGSASKKDESSESNKQAKLVAESTSNNSDINTNIKCKKKSLSQDDNDIPCDLDDIQKGDYSICKTDNKNEYSNVNQFNSSQQINEINNKKKECYTFDSITGVKKVYQLLNGGVFVLSKHKIVTAHALIYSSSKFPDSLSSKGAVFVRFKVNSKMVNVVATHLQAGDEPGDQLTRLKQVQELSNWVYNDVPNDYMESEEPLFFLGDFNIRYTIDRSFLNFIISEKILNCKLTAENLQTTYDSYLNDYCKIIENDIKFKYRYTLDYICVSKKSKVKIIKPQTSIQKGFKALTFVKFFLQFIPYKLTKIHHPSDHFPIYAVFQI